MCVKTKNTFFGVNSPNTVRKDTQEFKLPTALTTVKKKYLQIKTKEK